MAIENTKQDVADIKLPYKLIPFMKYRYLGFIFSIIISVLCTFIIVTKGLNWGLDFTGGTVIETQFSQPADLTKLRAELENRGYGSALVQTTGSQKRPNDPLVCECR